MAARAQSPQHLETKTAQSWLSQKHTTWANREHNTSTCLTPCVYVRHFDNSEVGRFAVTELNKHVVQCRYECQRTFVSGSKVLLCVKPRISAFLLREQPLIGWATSSGGRAYDLAQPPDGDSQLFLTPPTCSRKIHHTQGEHYSGISLKQRNLAEIG